MWGQDKVLTAAHPAIRTSVAAALLCGGFSGSFGGVWAETLGLLKVSRSDGAVRFLPFFLILFFF